MARLEQVQEYPVRATARYPAQLYHDKCFLDRDNSDQFPYDNVQDITINLIIMIYMINVN